MGDTKIVYIVCTNERIIGCFKAGCLKTRVWLSHSCGSLWEWPDSYNMKVREHFLGKVVIFVVCI